jgi:heme A synthase
MNIIFAILQKKNAKDTGWAPYALIVALLYTAGCFAGEYHWLSRAGYILQGRYFLPVSCALSTIFIHRIKILHILYAIILLVLNITLIAATFERYYNNDITVIREALPF